jgi:hypothetical protein
MYQGAYVEGYLYADDAEIFVRLICSLLKSNDIHFEDTQVQNFRERLQNMFGDPEWRQTSHRGGVGTEIYRIVCESFRSCDPRLYDFSLDIRKTVQKVTSYLMYNRVPERKRDFLNYIRRNIKEKLDWINRSDPTKDTNFERYHYYHDTMSTWHEAAGASYDYGQWEWELRPLVYNLGVLLYFDPCWIQTGQLEEVKVLEPMLSNEERKVANIITGLPRYTAYCTIFNDDKAENHVITTQRLPDLTQETEERSDEIEQQANKIREDSRTNYGRDRDEVERKIRERLGLGDEPPASATSRTAPKPSKPSAPPAQTLPDPPKRKTVDNDEGFSSDD